MPKVYTFMFFVSMALVVASVILLSMYGLKLGVDFRGGSLLELEFKDKTPAVADVQLAIQQLEIKDVSVSPVGDRGLLARSLEISEAKHQEVLRKFQKDYPGVEEKRFESVGPTIGKELKQKSITAIALVLLAIIIYIAIVFRRIGRVIPSWVMGIAGLIALVHDVIIPFGVFALLGYYAGIEISAVFVAAALTILGYSISDTVVVFDRVRENSIRYGFKEDFGAIVHRSILQTLSRSLNTTFTTLLSLLAIYFFGGATIKYFSLALIIGIFSGAYSSIFVASPIIVWWAKRKRNA